MRQLEFEKITAALRRAEFALGELQKKSDELHRKREVAKTVEELADLNLEAVELLKQLGKISDAVHTSNPAPHLRLVSDAEEGVIVDRPHRPARRRLLKSGKIFVGIHPIPCTIQTISETGARIQVETTAGIPAVFVFVQGGHPARTCRTIWRDDTQIGATFIKTGPVMPPPETTQP